MTREVDVRAGEVTLPGYLDLPEDPDGLVVFAHGSGSSRDSPRNQHVAGVLQDAGFATLLFDLLTPEEERDRANVFDIGLLAGRLVAAVHWVEDQGATSDLAVGLFGSSTGAAAALTAAVRMPDRVGAVVSRGGRPDLTEGDLAAVRAPTLLIVGGDDTQVIEMNRSAADELTVERGIHLVEGAGHLFEGPGQLDEVADRAAAWFHRHLP